MTFCLNFSTSAPNADAIMASRTVHRELYTSSWQDSPRGTASLRGATAEAVAVAAVLLMLPWAASRGRWAAHGPQGNASSLSLWHGGQRLRQEEMRLPFLFFFVPSLFSFSFSFFKSLSFLQTIRKFFNNTSIYKKLKLPHTKKTHHSQNQNKPPVLIPQS